MSSEPSGEPLFRIGILGATGFIGSPYRAEIRACDNARIIALCARREDLLEQAAAEDGALLATPDWRKVVTHPEVNFVLVATPDAFHHEAVLFCARHGRHLLCEKPVGMNAAEAREMLDACRNARPTLAHFVPFWTRMVEVFRLGRQMVAAGELGEIRSTVFRWQNPRPEGMPLTWRDNPSLSSAGTVADVGSHAYDLVRWIIGKEAEQVLAHGETLTDSKPDIGDVNLVEAIEWGGRHNGEEAKRRRGGTVDYATVCCRFQGGATGVFVLSHATFLRKHLAPELELHGTKASLSLDRWTGEIRLAAPGQPVRIVHWVDGCEFGNRFQKHVFPALTPILQGRAAALDYPDLEDGWIAQKFTDAASVSIREGRWVTL